MGRGGARQGKYRVQKPKRLPTQPFWFRTRYHPRVAHDFYRSLLLSLITAIIQLVCFDLVSTCRSSVQTQRRRLKNQYGNTPDNTINSNDSGYAHGQTSSGMY